MGHSVARSLVRSHRSPRFAMLSLLVVHSVHGLAHSLRPLPHGTAEIHEHVFMLSTRSTGTIMFSVLNENTLTVKEGNN